MKTQKLYGITFHFENFSHSLGRGLLEEILRVRFSVEPYLKNRALAENVKMLYKVSGIHLYMDSERRCEEEKFTVTSKFLISRVY